LDRQQSWIFAILALGYLLAFPVAQLLVMGNWSYGGYSAAKLAELYENLWKHVLMLSGFVVVVIAAWLNAFNGFSYLYDQRKVDFYHSLPIRRSWMFGRKLLKGLVYSFVPYVIMEFFSICIGAMRGYFSLHLMGLAAAMLFCHLLIYLMMYGVAVLAITMTGNRLTGSLLFVAFAAYSPVFSVLVTLYEMIFFHTYRGGSSFISEIGEYGSPVGIGWRFLNDYQDGSYTKSLLILIAAVLFFTAASYAAFMKRKLEKAGQAMIYKWSEPVVSLLVTVPSGLGIGIIFYLLPTDQSRYAWWIFGMILGTILVHGAIQVLYRMDFRHFFSWWQGLLLSAVLVAAIATGTKLDVIGYDSYLPDYEKMESISLDLGNISTNEYITGILPGEEEGPYEPWRACEDNNHAPYAAGVNQEIYNLLEEMVEGSETFYDGERIVENEQSTSLTVCYLLKSGKEIYRSYMISQDLCKRFLTACYDEGTLKDYKYSFLNIDASKLIYMSKAVGDESEILFDGNKKLQEKFLEALKQDVADADGEVLTQAPCELLALNYDDSVMPTYVDGVYWSSYVQIYLYPGFTRSIAMLEEYGYTLSSDISIDSDVLELYDMRDVETQDDQEKVLTYTDPEQIEAIRKCLTTYELCPDWIEYELGVYVENSTNEDYYLLIKDQEPDFLREALGESEE
jgi:ABC-2 type transport system permease protein